MAGRWRLYVGMKVNELYHPHYNENLGVWQAIEDVCAGARRVKSRKEVYLPRLSGQTDDEYKAYLMRAVMFNATKRTREALTGMLMRKQPKIVVPDEIETLTADIDLEGSTAKNWVRTVAQQIVSTGRGVTIADFNDEEQRPYLAFYPAIHICNWGTGRINGRNELTLLIVKETIDDETSGLTTEQFRKYVLTDAGVIVSVWKAGESKDSAEMVQTSQDKPLVRKGKVLKRIPATFHNAGHLGPAVGEAPLSDIADLNIHHFMASADLENGRHICGIPTPYATGVDSDNDTLKLGSNNAWTSSEPQAKFGFIEFTGQGLEALTTSLKEKESQMAILGARLLFDQKKDAESYETVRLRSVSETSALSNMSGYLSASLTQAIRWFIWWQGTEEDPSKIDEKFVVLVNDDFVDTPMDSTLLTALVAALQGDCISFDTFFHQLQKGEVYPDDWDLTKEVSAISRRPIPEPTKPDPKKPDPNADPNAN